MSKIQQTFLISPPLFLAENEKIQNISSGHICSGCHGNKWFWSENDQGERVKEPCKTCKGSGKLRAVITVSWEPDI